MIENLISGIKSKIDAVKETMSGVANAIKEFIHFSEPDVGHLSDFHTYAPDMMKEFADGIRNNAHLITDAVGSSFDLRPYMTSMTSGINRLSNIATSSMNAQGAQGPVVVQVSLEGDANRLFRVLSEEAHRDWQITGQSKLMGY
jgi:phage-related protein